MMRPALRPALNVLLALALPCILAAAPAQARKAHRSAEDGSKDATMDASKDGGGKDGATKEGAGKDSGKPEKVATFDDWGAYLAKGKGKARTCYALAKPQDRKPEGSRPEGRKDSAYVFIADRPNEKVHNEVSIMMGFPIKENGTAQAMVGKASFDLVAKDSNAWIKNPDEEAKFVEALQHSAKLIVKASPMKGPPTVDSYSLAGFKQALLRVGKDCR